MELPTRMPGVGTTIFTVMSQLATEHKAINLGQGFPDFNPDPLLLDEVNKAMQEGHNQYPPMPGIPLLREGIREKVKALYGHDYNSDTEITVMAGASEALMMTIMALVHPGDEVVVIEPFYDLYNPVIALAGATPVIVPMQAPDASHDTYRVDWQRVRDAITSRTRALILNFPHNPTGINLTEADLDALERIVEETGIFLISDEVYEHIVFDGKQHQSLCRRKSLAEKSVVISSFGKTYHVTGWKIGYCCAPAAITAEIRKLHQFNVFTVVSPMQWALARYMANPQHHLDLAGFYQAKQDRLFNGLLNTRFKPVKSAGTFFLLADYSEISDMPESEFAKWLTIEHGVGVIPLSAFYRDPAAPEANHGLVRFCFAKKDATLDQAIERLSKL
ncbi:methionine aminotransferase [Achromobacter sp. F4_2707]|uniref:methionine aminotransferase n=1 Tax=Achromobacter sp. F4_2707 TaxID=3114286 RepID=UPI0039C6FE30